MQRPRGRVRWAFCVDIAAATPELTCRPDGLLDRGTVGHGVGVRRRSDESHSGTFGAPG